MSKQLWASMVGRLAGISDEETRVVRRGFAVERPEVADRLEAIGRNFVWGYNVAVRSTELATLTRELAQRPAADAGFCYEGAAMGLAVRDWMTPGANLLPDYISGPARGHEYMAWVGMGWAFARLPIAPVAALERHASLSRWLALDGYGFHQGYFHWRKYVSEQRRPRGLGNEAARVFDQGLGRSLWFVKGASTRSVSAAIESFDEERQADLWSGIGLAAAYAGEVTVAGLHALASAAASRRPAFCQGIVFAAQARRRAGNPARHTEIACEEVLGLALESAAQVAVSSIPSGTGLTAYQSWRLAIQKQFAPAAGYQGGP